MNSRTNVREVPNLERTVRGIHTILCILYYPWMVTPTSGIVRPIIHGGRSSITYSLTTTTAEKLTTHEAPLPQVGQLSCTISYLQCHM